MVEVDDRLACGCTEMRPALALLCGQAVEAEDYLARVFQHENDHLDGKLFLDHLPPDVLNDHRAALLAMQRQARLNLDRLAERARQDAAANGEARRDERL